jgi:phage host-nuclease inhibitor protein Gam
MNAYQLNEFEEIEMVERERFQVNNIDQVNWAFRKIAALKAKQAEVKELADGEMHRIMKWFETETAKLTDNIAFFEGLLTEYALNQRATDPDFKKASTPYGTVKFRKQPAKWIYDDETLLHSLKANGLDDLIRVKEEPNKAEIKKRLVHGAGVVADPETGVQIEGVKVEEQPDAISVEVG